MQLELTSPHMKGHDVRVAQYLLHKNRQDIDFHPGQVDGVYGETTASATKRAKWLLGFPEDSCTGAYGPRLHAYLVHKGDKRFEERPKTWQIRGMLRYRKWKKEQEALKTGRGRALKIALAELNVSESPAYSNRVKYAYWYGLIGPWCAMFVSWCYTRAGRPMHDAAVSTVYYNARAHHYGFSIIGSPEPGDIVILHNIGHIGLFVEWTENGYFKYVSGNTSSGSESDGGAVEVHTLHRSIVNAWVRKV